MQTKRFDIEKVALSEIPAKAKNPAQMTTPTQKWPPFQKAI
jgi:hypothetical protein